MRVMGLDPTKVYATTDVPEFATGTIAFADDDKGYVFVQAAASTAIGAGDVCIYSEAGEAFDVTSTLR